MAGGPFDYITPNSAQNPFATTLQGFQAGQQIGAQQQQQALQSQAIQAQLEQQRAYHQDVNALIQNPNAGARDFAAFQLKYPQFKEATKDALSGLSEEQRNANIGLLGRAYSALNAGRQDLAVGVLEDRLKAMQNSGAPQDQINALHGNIQLVKTLPPDQARNTVGMMLSTVADPKQFAQIYGSLGGEQRAQELQPAKLKQETATLAKTNAEIDNTKSQIAERAARFGLDQDKFNLDFDKALEAQRAKNGGVTLSPGMEKAQADVVGTAAIAQQNADSAEDLATQFRAKGGGYGVGASIAEKFAGLTGRQDDYTLLRKKYIAMKNQAALGMLPPGPASDKDIATIQAGFLPETADASQIADWLQSFANVQKAVALRDNAKADWISEVGNTGTTRKDIEINGIKVPAGTAFNDFVRRGLKVGGGMSGGTAPAAGNAGPRYLDKSTWGNAPTTAANPAPTQYPSGVPG